MDQQNGLIARSLPGRTSNVGRATAMTQQATRHARRVYVGGLPPIANEQTVALFFNQVMAAIGGNTFGLGDAVVNMKLIFEFIQNILGGIIIWIQTYRKMLGLLRRNMH